MEERTEYSSLQLRSMLYALIDYIDYYERMTKQHDCNDCGIKDNCEYVPDWGKLVRVNCPLWKEDENGVMEGEE